MPRSRNTRIRPKNTSRADARRRHRDEQRALEAEAEAEPETTQEEAGAAEAAKGGSMFSFKMPNIVEDLRALPQILRTRWMWVPFVMLAATFLLSVAVINEALDGLPDLLVQGVGLYINLTLGPMGLFLYFIGGFLAPRGSWLIGGLLGLLSGIIYAIVIALLVDAANAAAEETLLANTGEGTVPAVTAEFIVQNIAFAVVLGVFAGGFAAWYRRFLRSSQERAKLNRMAREQEQARKAKEQAKADKQAAREARRRRS